METPEFEWDDKKASSNLKKHDVSFEEEQQSSMTQRLLQYLTQIIQKRRKDIFPLEFLCEEDYW